jgi:hypothetical protein
MKLINFLPCKKDYYVKWQANVNFYFNCAFYGLNMEPEPIAKPVKIRNWNRTGNLSKVGTGTVKNSYGSATLQKIIPRMNSRTFFRER